MTTASSAPPLADLQAPATDRGNNIKVRTSNTDHNTTTSDYDTEFFQRVVADAGRWAYGVVFVEVWVMNENRTHLVRPEGGFWVDQVSVDYGQNDNCKFQRLIDPTLDDYFPPTPRAPGVGIPGALWAQAQRGNLAVEHSSSVRNGTIFGGRNRHRRNRTLFPFDTVRGGTIFAPNENEAIQAGSSLPPYTPQPLPPSGKHRRSVSMDVRALAAAPGTSRRQDGHRKLFSGGLHQDQSNNSRHSEEDVETGRWASSWRPRRNFQDGSTGSQNVLHRNNLLPSEVRWRRISELSNDPDQPFNPRIYYLENECELGFAAGVPFHIGATEGIVVYMARKTADVKKLVAPTNEEYLTHSSLLIGSAFALRKPRLAAEKERHLESDQAMRRLKTKMQSLNAMTKRVQRVVEEESMRKKMNLTASANEILVEEGLTDIDCCSSRCPYFIHKSFKFMQKKGKSCVRKFFGSGTPPPPPFTWEQTFVTFLATCITLLVIISIDSTVVETYGQDFGLVLGPFGALMTLLFSLTSAPASQPQNCIFGQFVSLFIAYGFGRSAIDRRVKACLSTSLSITVMARLGITHPPAGASAMLFSSGDHSLAQIGAMLLGNVIAVVLGTWFNNLSDKRQYPTAWFPLCNGQMDSTCWTCEQEKAAPSNTAPTLKSMNTRRPAQAPLRSSKEMHKAKNPILVPNVTQAAAALAANEKKEAQSPVDNHERPPLLQAIASFVTGEASKAIDEKSSPGNEDIHSSRSSGSNEGNIDLKTVLHQAHNPTFIIDHGDNVTNRSVFRISTAFHNTDGSLRYRQYVMNEHSQSNNSGTIDLSEVLATAARQSNSSNLGAAANQTFIRLPEDGRSKKDDGHSLSLNCRDPDGLMNAPSANISSTMESFDEVMQNVDSDDELSVIEA